VVSSRFRAILLLVFLFLAAQSLGVRSELPAKIETVFEPFRAVAAIAAPLGWISHGEARAAEQSLAVGEETRRDAARALLAAAESSAAPSERALAEGKGLLHAEVVELCDGDTDRPVVRFARGAGVRRGMPVVCGDAFVGRVVSVDEAEAGLARVDLVTRRDFRVGAEIVPATPAAGRPDSANAAPVQLVVGGVLPHGITKEVLLEARTPHGKATEDEVRVLELERKDEDPYRTLANGFRLGTLVLLGSEGRKDSILGVRPTLDYKNLSHFGILCPAEHTPAGPDLARDPFSDEHWIPVQFALAGTASFWRETRRLSRPSGAISGGAAVVLGSNLLGCVEPSIAERTAPSRVALLGDPGFEVTAMASPVTPAGATAASAGEEARASVVTVGNLVSLGRNRGDGTLRFRWDPSVRTAARDRPAGATEVILYTASGHRSVPPGLVIGRTVLPDVRPGARGPFVLAVRQEETGLSLAEARVWCDRIAANGETAP
jgi:hypothetical protein